MWRNKFKLREGENEKDGSREAEYGLVEDYLKAYWY
jgi:hypothetical protein